MEPLPEDGLCCATGDETLICEFEAEDLFDSVGEIGGETDKVPLTGSGKYSHGDFVGIGGNGGGR